MMMLKYINVSFHVNVYKIHMKRMIYHMHGQSWGEQNRKESQKSKEQKKSEQFKYLIRKPQTASSMIRERERETIYSCTVINDIKY